MVKTAPLRVGTVKADWLDMDGTVKAGQQVKPEPCLDAYSGGNLQLFGISSDAFSMITKTRRSS